METKYIGLVYLTNVTLDGTNQTIVHVDTFRFG